MSSTDSTTATATAEEETGSVAATESSSSAEPITETITESNVDEIVETLYNTDEELIGYACKQILQDNASEPMDLMFYLDVLTPTQDADSESNPQEEAIAEIQQFLLQKMSREFLIDPGTSRGQRCFDLPVDGSTWIVQMTLDPRDFTEIELFGGCRELEWDPEKQDCKFYEAHMKGAFLGAVFVDKEGTPFGDAVEALRELIDDGDLEEHLITTLGGGVLGRDQYATAFLGVPRAAENPNFSGGYDQGRDVLNEPTNIKTGILVSQSKRNRSTITVVGGLLVACFSIAFALVGYILYKRRKSYRKNQEDQEDDDALEGVLEGEAGAEAGLHYDIDMDRGMGGDGDMDMDYPHKGEEYPNLPMSAEAIQMDLGHALHGQMMGSSSPQAHGHSPVPPNARLYSPDGRHVGEELLEDETDSWAQTDGTIGSLDPHLEPITAEV